MAPRSQPLAAGGVAEAEREPDETEGDEDDVGHDDLPGGRDVGGKIAAAP